MKIRKGFVSNSSSSSFILALDKKPKSVSEMKELLFGDAEFYYDPYYDESSSYFQNRTEKYPTKTVAKTVFEDIKDQKPMTLEDIAEELSSGWGQDELVDGTKRPEYSDFRKEGESFCDSSWEEYDKA